LPLTPRAVKVVLAVESISGVIYLRCIQAVRLGEDEERLSPAPRKVARPGERPSKKLRTIARFFRVVRLHPVSI